MALWNAAFCDCQGGIWKGPAFVNSFVLFPRNITPWVCSKMWRSQGSWLLV